MPWNTSDPKDSSPDVEKAEEEIQMILDKYGLMFTTVDKLSGTEVQLVKSKGKNTHSSGGPKQDYNHYGKGVLVQDWSKSK